MSSASSWSAAHLSSLLALEGVASALASARDGFDALLRDRGQRRTTPELTAESLLRGAIASAVLEGSTSTDEQIRAGAGDAVAVASLRLSTGVLGLAPTLRTSPLGALARLHAIAAGDTAAAERLGRPLDVPGAMTLQRVGRLVAEPSTRLPALLVAAVAHAELMTAAPFSSRDGLVARAVERLVLVVRGADERSLMVPEAGHLHLRAAYASNLRAWAAGDAQAWLLYAAEAYAAGAEASPLAG